jgi:hypothetical protein
MSALPTALLDDAPLPWRLTHSDRRRKAAATVKCDATVLATVSHLLDRCLEVLSRTPEPAVAEPWIEYWGFTADWLAEAMPELADIQVETVTALLVQKGPGQEASAQELAMYFSWWVLLDLSRSLLAWLRDTCRSIVDPRRFMELAARRWRGIDPWLAEELFRAAVEIAGRMALPLLESVERDPTVLDRIREAARNYRGWIDLPSGPESKT